MRTLLWSCLSRVANTGEAIQVAPGIRAGFRIAGHILGSSLVLLEVDQAGADGKGRRVYSFPATWATTINQSFAIRSPPPACDYLLVESTYGDRLHDPEDPKVALARIINDAAEREAPVLIPAFAVGRTQELVYLIRELEDEKAIPVLPVTVDSPMAAATTTAYANRKEEHDEEYASILTQQRHPLRTHSMTTASSRQESKKLNDAKGARVIISASGMMTGGRVLHHALRLVPDPEATIIFVGFQAAGTLGRRILDGEPEVKILGQWVPVRCRMAKIGGFSAHADWSEVLRWLAGMESGVPTSNFFDARRTRSGERDGGPYQREVWLERTRAAIW